MRTVQFPALRDRAHPESPEQLDTWVREQARLICDRHGRTRLSTIGRARVKKIAAGNSELRPSDLARAIDDGVPVADVLALVYGLRRRLEDRAARREAPPACALALVQEIATEGGEAIGAAASVAVTPHCLSTRDRAIREVAELLGAGRRALAWLQDPHWRGAA